MKLKEKYAYRSLKRKADAVSRLVKLPDPNSMGKVGIVWQPNQKEAYIYLREHFSHSQVIVRNICVCNENIAIETATNVLTPQDINWLGFPKKGVVDEFINTEFDLLLSISMEQNIQIEYITALSRAHFKIGGVSEEVNYFDLNINLKNKKDYMFLAKQQIFYLEQFNKKE